MPTHGKGQFVPAPWKLAAFRQKSPASLRLAALQIAYLTPATARIYAKSLTQTWWQQLAECRLYRPEQWDELCQLLDIDRVAIEPAQRSA